MGLKHHRNFQGGLFTGNGLCNVKRDKEIGKIGFEVFTLPFVFIL